MYAITGGILILLAVLIVLILLLLLKREPRDISAKIDSSLREQFLTFQSNISREISSTREEVTRSKDLISEHTMKTIETVKDMGGTIQQIIHQQEETQKLGQSLKDLLQAPKLRGSYGEHVLEEMLERVLPKGIWERQYPVDGREEVDAIVRFKDIVIPIDAKFPRDDYRRYLEATAQDEREKHWKSYESALKTQIKSIREKYIKPEKGTSEFALMFIPSEAIYYETIAEKNFLGQTSKIYEYAQENSVVPVSPNTFYIFLQVIMAGIRNIEVIKGARKLQDALSSVQKSFEFFYRKYSEIGQHIEKAHEAYRVGDRHIETYKKRLDSTLQFEEVAGSSEKSLPEQPAGSG